MRSYPVESTDIMGIVDSAAATATAPPHAEGSQVDSVVRQDLQDIAGHDDVVDLLRDFYGRAFRDELLGPVFVDVARMDLEVHLPVICDFWETVLFRAGSYRRNALRPHQRLAERADLTPSHFARWLALWRSTLDERHVGPKAELAKLQGCRVAGAMSRRITGITPTDPGVGRP